MTRKMIMSGAASVGGLPFGAFWQSQLSQRRPLPGGGHRAELQREPFDDFEALTKRGGSGGRSTSPSLTSATKEQGITPRPSAAYHQTD